MPLASFLPTPPPFITNPTLRRTHLTPTCCSTSKPPNSGISVKNVSYWWRNGRIALDDVSLDVAPGELAMIVGENGSGKSTLLKLIRGILLTEIGEITLQRPCAYVDQSPDLQIIFPTLGLDIAASIRLDPESDNASTVRQKVVDALESVGLVPAEDFIKTSSHRLSGGQKQRAVVAAAIAMEPASFLLDEVTASMDPVNRAELVVRVRKIVTQRNIAAIWVTHLLEELDVADTIIVMRRGRVIAKGPRVAMMPLVYDLQEGLL